MTTPYIASQPEAGAEAPATMPDWRELVTIVIERAWFGLLVALAVFLFFWLDARRQTPYYRSVATLIVEVQVPHLETFMDLRAFNIRNLEYFNTHIKAMHSRRMMQRAIELAGLDSRPGFMPGVAPGPAQAERALRFVNIAPLDRSRLIEIRVEHPDPHIAADLANALATAYIQQDMDNRMSASLHAVEWLRARADEYRQNLEAGLLELQQYRETTQSVSLEEDQDIVISKLKSIHGAHVAATIELLSISTTWSKIEALIETHAPLTEVALLLDDPSVRDAYRQLGEQQRKIGMLRQRYLPGHPDYQIAQKEAESLKEHFDAACERAVQGLRSRYELARQRETNLREALRAQEQEAFELDRNLVRYNDLKRNVHAEQEIYNALIGRMKETSLSGTSPSEIIRLVEEARPAGAPFRPNPRQAMMRGGSMGVVLGLAAIFLLYFADHRFRRIEEVERQLRLPVLGTLPLITAKNMAERGRVAHEKNSGAISEAVRTVRARLMMDAGFRERKCLMVTSAHAGEGKSLVASNLAISFAQDGQKTLLLGVDLRRPCLHKIFPSQTPAGLVDVLKGETDWVSATIRDALPGLDVLPAGRGTSHPSELLGSRQLSDLIREARQVYDRVILDSPPVLGLSDALTLLGQADSVLFVVRYAMTHTLGAKHAIQRVELSGTPCAGCIMNGFNLRSFANYYYYRRYGGYAYYQYKSDEGPGVVRTDPS